jgi:cytoskeleton protein RodZ
VSADRMLSSEPVAPVPAAMAPKPAVKIVPHVTPPPPAAATQTISPPASPNNSQTTAPAATPVQGMSASIAPPAQTPAVLPQGHPYGLQNGNARVILRATGVTHVLVMGPDHTVFINRVLQPGDSYRVPDVVGATLTTPDGGAVQVELDGQSMGLAGKQSQMTEALSLDPQSIVDRSNKPG